jgi:hypothetical protein
MRFGSLRTAYALIGHPPPRHCGALREDANLRRICSHFQHDVVAAIEAADATVVQEGLRLYRINDQFNLRLAVVAATRARNGSIRSRLRAKTPFNYDVTLAARMDPSNSKVLDYYFLPNLGYVKVKVSLGDSRRSRYNHFRAASLKPLLMLCSLKQTSSHYPKTSDEFTRFFSAACDRT